MNIKDDTYWNMIHNIGWGKSYMYKQMAKELEESYSKDRVEKLALFVKAMKYYIQNEMYAYLIKNNLSFGYYEVSDDGMWDLTAHIVGLGKDMFYKVLADPSLAKTIEAHENFEYIFNHAYES